MKNIEEVTDVEVKEEAIPTTDIHVENLYQPERAEGESRTDYILRRKIAKIKAKAQIRGIPFWNSKTQGTYIKAKAQ